MRVIVIEAQRFLDATSDDISDSDFKEFNTPEELFVYIRDNQYLFLMVGNEKYIPVIIRAHNKKELIEVQNRFYDDPDILAGSVQMRRISP